MCVIGDVGSGKTSLLRAINGDMIYLPESALQKNGFDIKSVIRDVIKEDLKECPIKVSGSVSYVEQ